MITKAYSVFDSKAAFFGTPFFYKNDALAFRAFGDLVNDPRSAVHLHPEDYSLYHVGSFDDSVGLCTPVPQPVVMVVASSMVKPVISDNEVK